MYFYVCILLFEASRGAAAQSVTIISAGFGLDLPSCKLNIVLHLFIQFFAVVSR